MPWRYQWTIGTGDAGGQFCRDFGFNGGFTDHGEGPLDWLARWNLRFYNDHTAGKGDLHLHGAEKKANFQPDQRNPRVIRHGTDGPRPIDARLTAPAPRTGRRQRQPHCERARCASPTRSMTRSPGDLS